jgi:hypothetical protein
MSQFIVTAPTTREVRLAMPTWRIASERNWLTLMGKVIVEISSRLGVKEVGRIRRQVAAQLGISDRDQRVAWVYRNEKAEACVRIRLKVVK